MLWRTPSRAKRPEASPGFARVSITPAAVDFAYRAVAAHPRGTIVVESSRSPGKTRFTVNLPTGVSGVFAMAGQRFTLEEGANEMVIDR